MKKLLIFSVLWVVLILGLLIGCTNENNIDNNEEINESKDIQLGELNFEPIDEGVLVDDSLKNWFENSYRNEGISAIKHDENVYILLGAGEQRTGGYSIEITSVVGKENEIVVNGKLNSPKAGEMVIQAITFPNTMIKIPRDDRRIALGSFDMSSKENINDNKMSSEVIEGEGIYVGQADSNVVEIIVKGNPQGFTISEEIKDYFDMNSDSYKGLAENDKVKFSYYEDKSTGQLIISDIFKMENNNEEVNTISGKYIGQIDSNSIEIEVNGEIGAYRLSEEAKSILLNGIIEEGDNIYFEYEKNEYNEVIVIDIKKINK